MTIGMYPGQFTYFSLFVAIPEKFLPTTLARRITVHNKNSALDKDAVIHQRSKQGNNLNVNAQVINMPAKSIRMVSKSCLKKSTSIYITFLWQ